MKITNSSLIVFWGNKANYRHSALLRTSWKNRKGNIKVTFQITQSASKRCLLPMLLAFPFFKFLCCLKISNPYSARNMG